MTMSPRILLVEDNLLNMELTTALLENAGYDVLGVETAEEAIPVARSDSFDLVLMDIALPGMDGLTATRLLKQQVETANLPVIALTAHALREEHDAALEAGCDGYLTKPIDRELMLEVLRNQLEAA